MRRAFILPVFVMCFGAAMGCNKQKEPPQRFSEQQRRAFDAVTESESRVDYEHPTTSLGERASDQANRARAAVPDVVVTVATDAGESWFSRWVASRYGAGVGFLLSAVLALVKVMRR